MKTIVIIGIISWIVLWFTISLGYFFIIEFIQNYMTKGSMFILPDYSPVYFFLFLIFGAFLGSLLLKRCLEK
jgi:uncharacterized protein YneF (UPF0154 family)